ncbi:MAG: Capsule polysaccharide biosynthesis protein [Betaproteobacteria bacterium ADurb.Bin341]|nr:MAG: Capsule polysaccharide biosynthesis protein [Betaproteobacteria bacterium ADurb.Bin341]
MKIALYMTGSFAKVLRRFADYLPNIELSAACTSWQAYEETLKEPRIQAVDYLYQDFNALFDQVDVAAFCAKYAEINLYEVMQVDKAHFKKKPGNYQLRYICAMGEQIARFFEKTRPDYVFFPIIETNDAMMAYRLAQHFGIRPIINSHGRFANLWFFSDSHRELLPAYLDAVDKPESDQACAIDFLEKYRANPGPFNYRADFPGGEVYPDFGEETTAFQRLIRNIRLKFGQERHNCMISLWIRFQVHFQHLFLPVRNFMFRMNERFCIRPQPAPEGDYDFFPLHFSPESSINVPAPFYIDQIRVVDKILLEREGNRTLVVKEHPAMFGFREKGFYRTLKRRPFVSFVHRTIKSYDLIRKANTVFSVTGTACLEAFFFGVKWVQLGDNYLSDWVHRRQAKGAEATPVEFIRDVRSVSSDFVLYSPGRCLADDRILFARKNIEKLCAHLEFHIRHDQAFRAKNGLQE